MNEIKNRRRRRARAFIKHRVLLGMFARDTYVRDVKWLNIEFSSKCNLRCKWCSLDHTKPSRNMPPELLARVIDEISNNRKFRIDRIDLHNAGETLLHPNFEGLITLLGLKKRAVKKFPYVCLLTNGILLDDEHSRFILESGAVDLLRISIDGGNPAAFEEIRRGAKWPKLAANVRQFMAMKQAYASVPKTGVICIVGQDKPLDQTWMDPEFREILNLFDHVELRHPHNWDGSKELGLQFDESEAFAKYNSGRMCEFLVHSLVVLPDGDVTICCADLNSRGVIGNLENHTLEELARSEKRRRMIEDFAGGKKKDIPACADCTGYYL